MGGVEAKAEELASGRVTPSPAPGVEILEIVVESDADDPFLPVVFGRAPRGLL